MKKLFPKNILFLAGVHGDEKIGIEVLRKLEKEVPGQKISWIVANERAIKKGKRFIDTDLNRSAPGSRYSKKYEVRRAYEIMKIAKNYDFVIDLHGSVAKTGIFIVMPNPKLKNLKLADSLPIKNVVIWVFKETKRGPVAKFVNYGLGIECGPKNSRKIKRQLLKILKSFLKSGIRSDKKELKSKKYFKVYGKILVGEIPQKLSKKLKDFKNTRIGRETFYPILVGGYKKEGILCYKIKKISPKRLK